MAGIDIPNLDLNPESGFDELVVVSQTVYDTYKIYSCRACGCHHAGGILGGKSCRSCRSEDLVHTGLYSYDGTQRELRVGWE